MSQLADVQRSAIRTVDRVRTTALASIICASVRKHLGQPPSPDAILEALNAVAATAALLIAATTNRPLARQFFDDALSKELKGLPCRPAQQPPPVRGGDR